MRVLMLVLLSLMMSCTQDAAWHMDAPRGDRLHAVARALSLTADAQEAAVAQAIDALALASRTQVDQGAIVADARRAVQRLRTRAQLAGRRLEQARLAGDMLFEQWDDEIGTYSSRELAREASRQRGLVRARFDDAIDALDGSKEAFAPVLRLLDDRILSLQHAIAANVEAPAPLATEVVSGEMLTRTRAARAACEAFDVKALR